jgi:hypothetical protein
MCSDSQVESSRDKVTSRHRMSIEVCPSRAQFRVDLDAHCDWSLSFGSEAESCLTDFLAWTRSDSLLDIQPGAQPHTKTKNPDI